MRVLSLLGRRLWLLGGVSILAILLLMSRSGGHACPQGDAAALYPDALERKQGALAGLTLAEHTFQRGEVLSSVLKDQGVEPTQAGELIEAARQVCDLTQCAPGDRLRLCRDAGGQIATFELHRASGEEALVCRTPLGFLTTRREPVYTTRLALAEGTINSSLYADAVQQGLDGRLVMELAEAFAWDIDFLTDLQPGDAFRVIYERKLADSGPARSGRILAAEVVNEGSVHTAYYFDDGEGHAGYFDAEGKSLRKEFLKSPLRFSRVTSGFTHSRLHPILKIRRPHLGVDYAAPSGTPVEAVADGRVVYCGWKTGFGNYLELKHKRGLTTCYGHLRGFAPGVRGGGVVQQGQVIAYVGATGMATGPHLDFRVAEQGVWVDPQKKHSTPAEPVPVSMRGRFREFVTQVGARFPSFQSASIR